MVTRSPRARPGARRVRALHRRLEREYGPPQGRELDPLDELMLTILSQNTSDTNRDRAYEALRERFPDWESVRLAPRRDIESAIQPAGLWKQKARVIQETLDRIHSENGGLALDNLTAMTNAQVIEYLTDFRGVGIKTAACVLCFSLGRPYMPVDTHVHRVTRRLGLVPAGMAAEQAHAHLNRDRVVPPEIRFAFHVELIRHGRAVCRSGRPFCSECVLSDLCPRIGVEESR